MILPHGTVIALVDGASLERYRNSASETAPLLTAMEKPKFHHDSKLSSAQHGSTSSSATLHQLEESSHAASVADWLNQQVLDHKIQHLVVIAPPRTLGEMRRRYHKELDRALVLELRKDLIGRSATQIMDSLRPD